MSAAGSSAQPPFEGPDEVTEFIAACGQGRKRCGMCRYVTGTLEVHAAVELYKEGDKYFARRWNVSPSKAIGPTGAAAAPAPPQP